MTYLRHSDSAISDAVFMGLTVETSHIAGTPVASSQDVDLGKVVEVVMDAFNSRIAYVVISFGGFVGIGAKRYAAPWNAMQHDNVQQIYRLNLTQDEIAELPDYDKDNWPDFSADRWNQGLRSVEKLTPLWMP